jgi:hypothetical protein
VHYYEDMRTSREYVTQNCTQSLQRILDLRRQDEGLIHQDAQSNLWHAAIILVILQEVVQRH